MDNLCFKIPVVTYGALAPEETSQTTSRGRVRIFYKGLNRNGTYITDEFAEKLITTLPYTPVKGIYDKDVEDYTDHGEERSEGRIYGVVPENPNFAWEQFTDEDGVTRTYACCDVLYYTALYEEAAEIIGKGESMELYLRSIEGDWQVKEGKKCFVFSDGCFLGLQALGDDVEPCFEGAAFYDFNQNIYTILKNVDGGNPMNDEIEKEVFEEEATVETPVETEDEAKETPEVDSSEVETEATEETVEESTEETVDETVEDAEGALTETDGEEEVPTESTVVENDQSEKISELESKISELNSLNATLQMERDSFAKELEEAKIEISSLRDAADELAQYKKKAEDEKKKSVIDEYASKLSEEILKKYTDSLDDYTAEDLDKELCYEMKKGNPSLFFGSDSKTDGVIPKQIGQSITYKDSVCELLSKYENK